MQHTVTRPLPVRYRTPYRFRSPGCELPAAVEVGATLCGGYAVRADSPSTAEVRLVRPFGLSWVKRLRTVNGGASVGSAGNDGYARIEIDGPKCRFWMARRSFCESDAGVVSVQSVPNCGEHTVFAPYKANLAYQGDAFVAALLPRDSLHLRH